MEKLLKTFDKELKQSKKAAGTISAAPTAEETKAEVLAATRNPGTCASRIDSSSLRPSPR